MYNSNNKPKNKQPLITNFFPVIYGELPLPASPCIDRHRDKRVEGT